MAGYNTTQKYFILTDLAAAFFWLFLLARLAILYPLVGPRFLPGGIADFHLSIIAATVFLELFNYLAVFRYIPNPRIGDAVNKPKLFHLISTSLSRLIICAVIYEYPSIIRSDIYSLFILAQSIKEIFRWFFNFQKVKLFNNVPKSVSFLRSLSYSICTPIESLCFIYFIMQSLVLSPVSDELKIYNPQIRLFLKCFLFVYLPVFYKIYKHSLVKYTLHKSLHKSTKPISKTE